MQLFYQRRLSGSIRPVTPLPPAAPQGTIPAAAASPYVYTIRRGLCMRHIRNFCLLLLGSAILSACGPLRFWTSTPQPLPSPQPDWTLQLTQSGGFAGVQLWVQVTSAGRLSAADQRSGRHVQQTISGNTVAQLGRLAGALASFPSAPRPSACADCFVYTLIVTYGDRTTQIQADDATLTDSGSRELVTLLQSLRDTALASQP